MLERTCRLAAAAAVVAGLTVVGAPTSPHAAPATPVAHEAVAAKAAPKPSRLPRFGIMADAGLPDGANASIVVRPWRLLRLHGGLGYNGISKGVRGGATFVPFNTWFTPTLSVDYGRYFEGDANPLAARLSGDPEFHSDLLERVGYDYANAHVGLSFGKKWATFYLQAGASRIAGNVRNLNAVTSGDGMSTSVSFNTDPKVEIWSVSARLGFVFYILK